MKHPFLFALATLALMANSAGLALSLKPEEVKNKPFTKMETLANPFDQFGLWYDKAKKENIHEPSVFILATASRSGIPSSRAMMLNSYDKKGFLFSSSSQSFKAHEMRASPYVAATFWWPEQQRQIGIRGRVELLSEAESNAVFNSRPRESQIASWASAQGKEMESREQLHTKFKELDEAYKGKPIPVPPHWQVYRIAPNIVEFWQAGPHTLHDRVLYKFDDKGKWFVHALSP